MKANLKISIFTTDSRHPVVAPLRIWASRQAGTSVSLIHSKDDIESGDFLFLISCGEFVGKEICGRFRYSMVVHASELPNGRGWSPHIWQILDGAMRIPVALLNAEDQIDSGDIWALRWIELEGHELLDEINEKLFSTTLELLDFAIAKADRMTPLPQRSEPGSSYRKRTPADSRLDPEETIAAQFNLVRVADPDRFPLFFDFRGHRYIVNVRKEKKG